MASINLSLSLAKAHNSHVEILHATPGQETLFPIFLPQPGFSGEIFKELSSEANRHLETAFSLCTNAAERAGIDMLEDDGLADAPCASLHIVDGTLEKTLPQRARVADLIVMNMAIVDKPTHYDRLLRAALFKSGKPVLLVSDRMKPVIPVKKAVLAWNGSFEAARALNLSLPMLKSAKVLVYEGVEGEPPAVAASDVVVFLQRHGIQAEARQEFLSVTTGVALRKAADDYGADLLVMGAYSREDRWRETLLGSLTGDVLNDMNVPVLMAN
jgi:nucleotide-binding universal stress UspA family protein